MPGITLKGKFPNSDDSFQPVISFFHKIMVPDFE